MKRLSSRSHGPQIVDGSWKCSGRLPCVSTLCARVAVVLLATLTALPTYAEQARPNILFIHMEDMGVQIPAYGDHTVATPNLDRLAAEGIVFERAHVVAATCAASRGALFSGLHPHQNGIMGFIDTHGFHYREGLTTFVHAYYAAASFADAQVGRILQRLDELKLREKTVVVVWSDHGFHLGDQERWAKWTQFEADMRSPLMIRVPTVGQGGRSTNALVESVDVYPTLAAACGLKLPSHLEGVSLIPIIKRQADSLKPAAYSQVKGLKNHSNMLAYSVRTQRYRYMEWRDVSEGSSWSIPNSMTWA